MADEDIAVDQQDVEEQRKARYEESRRAAERLQASRRLEAQSDRPPGSPSTYLGASGQPLGEVQKDELGVTMPTPRGAEGLRGHPSMIEYEVAAGLRSALPAAKDVVHPWDQSGGDEAKAVASSYPVTPRFQMPGTDQLIDAGIEAKRNEVRNSIIEQTRLANATLSGVHPHQWKQQVAGQFSARIAGLQATAHSLDAEQREIIRQNTRLAIQSAKENEGVTQDTARAQVVDFLNNIDPDRYPHGSADREAFVGKVFANRPDWLHVMAKDRHLSEYVKEHVNGQDAVSRTLTALQEAYPDEESLPTVGGVRMVPNVNAKGQTSFRSVTSQTPEAKEQSKLAAKLHQTTGLTPEEFAAIGEDQVKAGGIFVGKGKPGEGVFHEGEGGFNVNGTPKGEFSNDFTKVIDGYKPGVTKLAPDEEKKAQARIASGGAIQIDTGKGYKAVIPRTLYERYKDSFGNEEAAPKPGKVMSVEDWLNQ